MKNLEFLGAILPFTTLKYSFWLAEQSQRQDLGQFIQLKIFFKVLHFTRVRKYSGVISISTNNVPFLQ